MLCRAVQRPFSLRRLSSSARQVSWPSRNPIRSFPYPFLLRERRPTPPLPRPFPPGGYPEGGRYFQARLVSCGMSFLYYREGSLSKYGLLSLSRRPSLWRFQVPSRCRGNRNSKNTPRLLLIRPLQRRPDRKSTRLNSSHGYISYAVFCLKKKTIKGTEKQKKGQKRQRKTN